MLATITLLSLPHDRGLGVSQPAHGARTVPAPDSRYEAATVDQLCLTCNGFPPGHPECAGVAFAQTFQDIPRAMWFVLWQALLAVVFDF